ncbi:MAG: substrate-binding domain-containing protein [Clostridiaceae bacterium]|nr:substrate-binding domain-containing protein [Clostridiaceae bacterium]
MKKLLAILLAMAMVFSLVACAPDKKPETPTDAAPTDAAPTDADPTDAEPTDPPKPDVAMSIVPASVVLSDSKALQGKKIGNSICYKGDEWCYQLSLAMETLGKYYGADIVVEDGDLNDETQTKQIENMLAAGVDIIMIDPTTPDGTHEALMKAVDADIPIIIYDGYWNAGEENAVTTVTWDQELTGTLIGQYFVQHLKDTGQDSVKIVELTNAVSTHCQERFVGLHKVFEEAAKEGIEIEILNKYDSQGNREMAYNAIAAVVEPYDYIISDVDNGAFGAVSALQAAGNTKVQVLSMGAYGEEPFTALYNNDANYMACLNVDPWILAQFIFDGAIDYFEGNEVPTKTNIALFVVDSDNVTDFWSFD